MPEVTDLNVVHQEPSCDQLNLLWMVLWRVQQHRLSFQDAHVTWPSGVEHFNKVQIPETLDLAPQLRRP